MTQPPNDSAERVTGRDTDGTRLKTLCSWCIAAKRIENEPGVSHGICRTCAITFSILPALDTITARLVGDSYLGSDERKDLGKRLLIVRRLLAGPEA